MTRKDKILYYIKSHLRMNHQQAIRWWVLPNHSFRGFSPEKFVKTIDKGWEKLDEIVRFSDKPLQAYCTKAQGKCAWCDKIAAQKKAAWNMILDRRPGKENSGTVATSTDYDTVATLTDYSTKAT